MQPKGCENSALTQNMNLKRADGSSRQNFSIALKKSFQFIWKVDETNYAILVDEIRIEGHTDSDGRYMYNMNLSQQRAKKY